MSKLIEAIARAIYDTKPGPDGTEIFEDEPWRCCLQCVPAALAAIEREGYRVVPVEPTEEMVKGVADIFDLADAAVPLYWDAMLSAFPKQG